MSTIELLFWIGTGIVVYSYVGYGIILFLMVKMKKLIMPEPKYDMQFEPAVSLVVPCFNEADYIEDKIKNSLALEYPSEKLQLIFISDGSNDDTYARVKKYPQVLARYYYFLLFHF